MHNREGERPVRLLAGLLPLEDVADTEAFCAAIVQRSRLRLSATEQEDLLVYLVETALSLSLAILRTILIPSSQGYSNVEIARKLGTTPSWVSSRLDELAAEVRVYALLDEL
jgi:hypothetical protein